MDSKGSLTTNRPSSSCTTIFLSVVSWYRSFRLASPMREDGFLYGFFLFSCSTVNTLSSGATAGFLSGIWVFCGIAVTGLFEHKSARYIFINGGYQVLALTLMGAIIGVWR